MQVGLDIESGKVVMVLKADGGLTTTATLDPQKAKLVAEQLKTSADVILSHLEQNPERTESGNE